MSIDPLTARRVGLLVDELGSPQIESREGAESELQRIGMIAIPSPQRALRSSDPEIRFRSRSALDALWDREDCRRLTRAAFFQRDRSDVQITGLALLCFLGAGYSHLSREFR